MLPVRASVASFLALATLYAACRVETPRPENTFELRGLHAELACEDCHAIDQPLGPLPTDCASCHLEDAPPLHFQPPCEACHDEFGWDRALEHGFLPLENAHALPCQDCHVDGDFEGLDAACSTCHEPDRPDPDHNPEFECSACHVPTTWEDAVDHTFFPLTDSHSTTCASCHPNIPDFSGNETTCTSCHEIERPPPAHFTGTDCDTCHAATQWSDWTYDHFFFPLTDSHAPLVCVSCHAAAPGDFGGESGDCASCHEAERPDVDHFPGRDCGDCHRSTRWSDGVDGTHDFFPLTDSHDQPCATCHPNAPDYSGSSPDCSNCHEAERPLPTHFVGQECTPCHVPTVWSEATYDHDFFPLLNAHAGISCVTCHPSTPNDFGGASGDCASCHETDRPNNHFPGQDCGVCHLNTAWNDGVVVDHSFFPLTGNHNVTCVTCHPNAPDYTGLSQACASCHEADRLSPTHFPGQDCGTCHVLDGWDVGVANHDFFPLVDRHAVDCVQCHLAAPNDYTGQSATCNSCHDPDAPGCHFTGETCANCHDYSASWLATAVGIDHASRFTFPVPHHNANQCDECHDTPNSQCDFNCLDCHGSAPNDHSDVNGFQNTSTACVQSGCHPDGRN